MNCPNLFDFATSELSQDAFLCWLFSLIFAYLISSIPTDPRIYKSIYGLWENSIAKFGHPLPNHIHSLSQRLNYLVAQTHKIAQ